MLTTFKVMLTPNVELHAQVRRCGDRSSVQVFWKCRCWGLAADTPYFESATILNIQKLHPCCVCHWLHAPHSAPGTSTVHILHPSPITGTLVHATPVPPVSATTREHLSRHPHWQWKCLSRYRANTPNFRVCVVQIRRSKLRSGCPVSLKCQTCIHCGPSRTTRGCLYNEGTSRIDQSARSIYGSHRTVTTHTFTGHSRHPPAIPHP